MAFVRRQEDFECEHCGEMVVGNGYTNHCPKCLWSKHVDTTPGDRESTCLGKMKPVRLEGGTDDYRITHKCETCGYEKRNEVAQNDSHDALIALAKTQASQH